MITKKSFENSIDRLFEGYNNRLPRNIEDTPRGSISIDNNTLAILVALNAGFNLLANMLILILYVLIDIRGWEK